MAKIRVSTVINASPRAVWRAIEDIESHVRWMEDAVAIRITSRTSRGVGTTFECDTRAGPFTTVDRMEIIEWQPRQAMGVRHSARCPAKVGSRCVRSGPTHAFHLARAAQVPMVARRLDRRCVRRRGAAGDLEAQPSEPQTRRRRRVDAGSERQEAEHGSRHWSAAQIEPAKNSADIASSPTPPAPPTS